jgi:hypothetical protein
MPLNEAAVKISFFAGPASVQWATVTRAYYCGYGPQEGSPSFPLPNETCFIAVPSRFLEARIIARFDTPPLLPKVLENIR